MTSDDRTGDERPKDPRFIRGLVLVVRRGPDDLELGQHPGPRAHAVPHVDLALVRAQVLLAPLEDRLVHGLVVVLL